MHFDGDLINDILTEHYNSPEQAKHIVDQGDLSSIDENGMKPYKERGDAWDLVKPEYRASLHGLMALVREEGGQYLNVFEEDGWQEYRLQ